jgi:UDP-glucose 4-epimerase
MNILVAGGAGYIGSHAVRQLLKKKHQVIVLDNLSHGYRAAVDAAACGLSFQPQLIEADISDENTLTRILQENQIEAVMHFAAFIEVGESVQHPDRYYRNNVAGSFSLLNSMKNAHVQKLVFSSTAAVYGDPHEIPISESHPCSPINPYGRTKMMVELAIQDYAKAYNIGYVILRYFNVAGASPEGVIGEAHEPESHLIPRVLAAATGQSESISIFGMDYSTPDGTCVRDYIHVEDLVAAHSLALENIQRGEGSIYNLGSERGFSVKEVIESCRKVTGIAMPVVEKTRRPGDPAILIASSAKIREELGWKRQFPDLDTIVRHAWNWQKNRNEVTGNLAA